MQQEREEKVRKGFSPSSDAKSAKTDEKRLELIEAIIKPGI